MNYSVKPYFRITQYSPVLDNLPFILFENLRIVFKQQLLYIHSKLTTGQKLKGKYGLVAYLIILF
jgi:hypothetical protein